MPHRAFILKRGITLPAFSAQLRRGESPVKLDSVLTIWLIWRPTNKSTAARQKEITIDDAAAGKVIYNWQPDDLIPGAYRAEILVQWDSGHVERFPSDNYLYFDVLETVEAA